MLSNLSLFLDVVIDAGHFCSDTRTLWQLIGVVVTIIKIVIPIIIIVLGMMDLGKAVMAGDEKEIKSAQQLLIKRLIYGVIIFFVVTIVQAVFGLIGQSYDKGSDAAICWQCATGKCPAE